MISNKIITITRLSNQILPVQPPNYNEYLRGKIIASYWLPTMHKSPECTITPASGKSRSR